MAGKILVLLAFCLLAGAATHAAQRGRVGGTARDQETRPLGGATVYLARGDDCLTAACNEAGEYLFDAVAPGTYDYLAVSVPPDGKRFPYLFVRRGLSVKDGETVQVDVAYKPGQPPRPPEARPDAPDQMTGPDKRVRSQFEDVSIFNPFAWQWERQCVGFRVRFDGGATPASLLVFDVEAKSLIPHQVSDELFTQGGRLLSEATIHFQAEVKGKTRRHWRVYYGTGQFIPVEYEAPITVQEDGEAVVLSTDEVAARFPRGARKWDGGREAKEVPAPLLAVRGADNVWRGAGRLVSPVKVLEMTAQVLQRGPIFVDYRVVYRFANGSRYSITFRFEADAPWFTVREECDGLAGGAFEFSAYPNFEPDEGYQIHWGLRNDRGWYTDNSTLCRIANYMHIWSFGYAATSSRQNVNDCLAVFSVNAGSWIDRRYAVDTWFPLGADADGQMQVPWVTYYGSPHSAISVERRRDPADLFFRFPLHDGTREWALTIYPKKLNSEKEGAHIRALRARVGDIPLDKFKNYVMEWEPGPLDRPCLNYDLGALPVIQANLKEPFFAALWEQERTIPGHECV